ncbi:MAG: class II glutamine amidotransferase, partial [bacterium]
MSHATVFGAVLASDSDYLPDSADQGDFWDKPQEACGVLGAYAPAEDVAKLAYFGLFALQHRGQESAGIETFEGTKLHSHKQMGLVSQVFNEDILAQLPGTIVVGHNRYSTTGSSKVCNAQPAILQTRLGPLALAHNGNLVNALTLRDDLMAKDHATTSTTDSELIAIAMADAVNAGESWCEAAITAFHQSEGAFSLVIGTPDGLMGARDPHGIRPLVIGTLKEPAQDGSTQYVLASETCALDILGATYLR